MLKIVFKLVGSNGRKGMNKPLEQFPNLLNQKKAKISR